MLEVIHQQGLLGKEFKIYGDKDNPLFLAKDVAGWIEHTDLSRMVNLVDAEEKLKRTLYVSGQNREMWFLTEYGLYEVLMQSRKPIAKQFKKEVKSILTSIRKNGLYATAETAEKILNDPSFLIKALQTLEEERKARKQAENVIEQQKPKVLFAESVESSENSILIGQLAKIITQNGYEIGQNRLFKWLRDNKYLSSKGAYYNEPMQRYVERGLFEVKVTTCMNADGSVKTNRTTKVTGKGQTYFVNKFLGAIK